MSELASKMKNRETAQRNTTFQLTPTAQLSGEQIEGLLSFYKEGYGDRWISDDHFRDVVMKNSSEVAMLYMDGRLAAASNINVSRITDISVDPEFRGQKLGSKLLQEIAQAHPDAWVSISVDATQMLATVTDKDLNFLPVEKKEEIESLFKKLNGVDGSFQVETAVVQDTFLSERFKKKGINKEGFGVFYRPGSLHGSSYKQILFQNQSVNSDPNLQISI